MDPAVDQACLYANSKMSGLLPAEASGVTTTGGSWLMPARFV